MTNKEGDGTNFPFYTEIIGIERLESNYQTILLLLFLLRLTVLNSNYSLTFYYGKQMNLPIY
jgi:hypothetical protein